MAEAGRSYERIHKPTTSNAAASRTTTQGERVGIPGGGFGGGGAPRYVNAAGSTEVPVEHETCTSTVPGPWPGVVAWRVVGLVNVVSGALTPPNEATQSATKSVPVSVVASPPAVLPLVGKTEVSTGGGGVGAL